MIFPCRSDMAALPFGARAYQPSQRLPVAARATVYSGIAHYGCALLARTVSAISAVGFDCGAEGGVGACEHAKIITSRCLNQHEGRVHHVFKRCHGFFLSIASTARRISSE